MANAPRTVQLGDGVKDAAKVKKVLTTRYNMEQLKKITEFDSWVDEELEKLHPGKANNVIEIDFDEWDTTEPAKRKAYLEEKLASLGDTPAKRKFVEEYSKRGEAVLQMLHDPELRKLLSLLGAGLGASVEGDL